MCGANKIQVFVNKGSDMNSNMNSKSSRNGCNNRMTPVSCVMAEVKLETVDDAKKPYQQSKN